MATTDRVIVIGQCEDLHLAQALAEVLGVEVGVLTQVRNDEFQLNRREVRVGTGFEEAEAKVRMVRSALRIIRGAETDNWTHDFFVAEAARQHVDKLLLDDEKSKLKRAELTAQGRVREQKLPLDLDRAQKELSAEWRAVQRNLPPEQRGKFNPWLGDRNSSYWTEKKTAELKERARQNLINDQREVKYHLDRIAEITDRMSKRPTYNNLVREIRANRDTEAMTKVGIHDLVNTLYFITGDSDEYDLKNYGKVPDHALIYRAVFDGREIPDPRRIEIKHDGLYSVGSERPIMGTERRRHVGVSSTGYHVIHEDWDGYTMEEFLRRYHVTVETKRIPKRTDVKPDKDDRDRSHYACTLNYMGRSMAVEFSMGSAHRNPPTVSDLLQCMASDSSSYDNTRNFEEWASEFGVDPDSRDGERTYNLIKKQRDDLYFLLGQEGYETLVWQTQND